MAAVSTAASTAASAETLPEVGARARGPISPASPSINGERATRPGHGRERAARVVGAIVPASSASADIGRTWSESENRFRPDRPERAVAARHRAADRPDDLQWRTYRELRAPGREPGVRRAAEPGGPGPADPVPGGAVLHERPARHGDPQPPAQQRRCPRRAAAADAGSVRRRRGDPHRRRAVRGARRRGTLAGRPRRGQPARLDRPATGRWSASIRASSRRAPCRSA